MNGERTKKRARDIGGTARPWGPIRVFFRPLVTPCATSNQLRPLYPQCRLNWFTLALNSVDLQTFELFDYRITSANDLATYFF